MGTSRLLVFGLDAIALIYTENSATFPLMKTVVTEEAIKEMEIGMEVLEWHMEGDVRVITKAKLIESSIQEEFITEYDMNKMKSMDTSDWF